MPPPHVAEQGVHDPHSPTLQSTETNTIIVLQIPFNIEYLPGSLQATLQLRISESSIILDFARNIKVGSIFTAATTILSGKK